MASTAGTQPDKTRELIRDRGINLMANEPVVPAVPDPIVLQRIAQIFAPHSAREVSRMYKGDKPEPAAFAHYTSGDNAVNIIRGQQLWLRSTSCMADYREVAHGHDMMLECFKDGLREKFIAALDDCRMGIATEAIGVFDNHYNDTLFNTFVACMSEHDEKREEHCGRLSMWRGFSPNSTRVALIFKLPYESEATGKLALTFTPVSYFSLAQMRAEIEEVIANVQRERQFLSELAPELLRAAIFIALINGHVSVKHPGFHEEREWRAVYGPSRWHSATTLESMSIETPNGVPQRIFKIPLNIKNESPLSDLYFPRIFHRLIIGPSSYGVAMADAFINELGKAGVVDPASRVVISDIPIRSLM